MSNALRDRISALQRLPRQALDELARRAGYVPSDEVICRTGYVYASTRGRPETEVCLGRNVLTYKQRVNAARLLARTAATWPHGPVNYSATGACVDGYTEADDAFPAYLAVGTGATAATAGDWTMTSPLYRAGAVAYYPLERVDVYALPGDYDPNPISVSFFYNIPAGESWDVLGTSAVIRELALFGDAIASPLPAPTDPQVDCNMLARKVVSGITKVSDLDLTIRWQWRT